MVCTLLWWELLVVTLMTALSLVYYNRAYYFYWDSSFRQKHFNNCKVLGDDSHNKMELSLVSSYSHIQ